MIELPNSIPTSFALLFMDECSYEPLDLAALTGVLVPLEKYPVVRDAMCRIQWDITRPEKGNVPALIELHANDLLRDKSDEVRIAVFADAVRIVSENKLTIFRSTYLNRHEIATIWKSDPNLYGLNFLNVQSWLERVMENTLVIPVMDGVPSQRPKAKKSPTIDGQLIRAFAQHVRMTHHIRQREGISDMFSIKNLENLGEPLFADSAHSTLIQLVDLVSYMLLQIEREELETGKLPSEYRKDILDQARKLEFSFWRGKMKYRNR